MEWILRPTAGPAPIDRRDGPGRGLPAVAAGCTSEAVVRRYRAGMHRSPIERGGAPRSPGRVRGVGACVAVATLLAALLASSGCGKVVTYTDGGPGDAASNDGGVADPDGAFAKDTSVDAPPICDESTCSAGAPDDCCPALCNAASDVDCVAACDNTIVEPGEIAIVAPE